MGTAYVDESMGTPGGVSMYLLGATACQDEGRQADRLASHEAKGARRLHRRELGRAAQAKVMEAIADMPATTTVVIGTPMNPHKQERARRKCLEAMMEALADDGVFDFVPGGRDSRLDGRDARLVGPVKSRGRLRNLRVSHMRGSEEPRLWVPDQVLGAYGDQLCLEEFDDRWLAAWRALEQRTHLEIINL